MSEALSEAPKRTARRPHCSPQERRRIVELTFAEGASVAKIAADHGVHHTSLSHWRSLYRAGKLDHHQSADTSARTRMGNVPGMNFLPVTIMAEKTEATEATQTTEHFVNHTHERSIVQITLPSGATLRMETGVLDIARIGTLLAEMRA